MEDDSNLKNKQYITLGSWILIATSIFSSLSRNDYNIIGGIIILILFNQFFKEYPKLVLKGIIHFLGILCVIDALWLIIMMFSWTHGKNTSKYWQSLFFIHNLIYFIGIIEFLGKGYYIYLLYNEYKNYGNQDELYDFVYSIDNSNKENDINT